MRNNAKEHPPQFSGYFRRKLQGVRIPLAPLSFRRYFAVFVARLEPSDICFDDSFDDSRRSNIDTALEHSALTTLHLAGIAEDAWPSMTAP